MPQSQSTGAERQAARLAAHVAITADRLKGAPTPKITRQQRRLRERLIAKRSALLHFQ